MKYALFILLFPCFVSAQRCCSIGVYTPPAHTYLLDTYTNLRGYSLNKISGTATNLIRVRRASDNAESDIGFTGFTLDVTTLGTFCSGTSCYVTTMYEQSGSGLDATNSETAKQLRIVNAGTLEVDADGNPVMRMTQSATTYLRVIYNVIPQAITNFSTFVVFSYTASSEANARLISIDANTSDFLATVPLLLNGTGPNFSTYNGGFVSDVSVTANTQSLLSGIYNSSGSSNRLNGGTAATQSFTFSRTIARLYVGKSCCDGGTLDGLLSEFIFSVTDESANRTAIETEINSRYTIF